MFQNRSLIEYSASVHFHKIISSGNDYHFQFNMQFLIIATIVSLSQPTTLDGTIKSKNDAFVGCSRSAALEERLAILETLVKQQGQQLMQNENGCTLVEECDIYIAVKEQISVLESVVDHQAVQIVTLQNEVADIEDVVLPGKIPASCNEYAQRGEVTSGVYQIRPSSDLASFEVFCDFRKQLNYLLQ